MLPPRKVAYEAKKRESENLRFRTFLKLHADDEELDRQFAQLHEELFAKYDCSRCRNCCKVYNTELKPEELAKAAKYVQLDETHFIQKYMEPSDDGSKYLTRHIPCDFLQKNGECLLGGCRPDNCKKYPYTNQPERIESLYSILNAVSVCPVAYEIWEKLKIMYKFC